MPCKQGVQQLQRPQKIIREAGPGTSEAKSGVGSIAEFDHGERGGQSLDVWEQRFTLNIKGALVDSKITINVCLQEVVEWNRSS